MLSVQLTAWQSPAELREVPVPEPGPGELRLRVRGAGLCHSDLHLMHWPAGTLPYELPFTLGHEVAGTVDALGDGPGDLVTEREGQLVWERPGAPVHQVQVRVAQAGPTHPDEHLAWTRFRHGHLDEPSGLLPRCELDRLHPCDSTI